MLQSKSGALLKDLRTLRLFLKVIIWSKLQSNYEPGNKLDKPDR
jgi:hypothetical protein